MNALSHPAPAFEAVSYADWSYIATPADFVEGCFIRTINGRDYGTGMNALGGTVTLPLNVPLCINCDMTIESRVCVDCGLVFTGGEHDAA